MRIHPRRRPRVACFPARRTSPPPPPLRRIPVEEGKPTSPRGRWPVETRGPLFSCGGWYHRDGKGVNATRRMRPFSCSLDAKGCHGPEGRFIQVVLAERVTDLQAGFVTVQCPECRNL